MPRKSPLPPEVLLFLRVIAAVFLAEALVMFILVRFLPALEGWQEALVDSTILTLLVAPLIWRWLVVGDRQRRRAESELQTSNGAQQKLNVALEKSRATFRALFEGAADALVVVDRRGRIVRINRMAENLFGYTHAELSDQPIEQLMPEGDRGRHVAHRENYQTSPRFRAMGGPELLARRKDGSAFPAEIMLSPLKTEEGDVVLATVRDLTARRLAEEEMEKFSRAVKQTSNCVLITDRGGVIEYVNPAFERMTGYAREEVIGKTPRVLRSGRHDQKFFESLWNTVLTGGSFSGEIINRKKSGKLYSTEQTITSIRDTHGHITHFVSVGSDITERKQAEQATLEQFKLSDTFFNNSVSCLIVLDKNFNFLRVNAAYARACRRDISEFAGRNHFDVYPSDAKLIFEEVVRTKQPFTTFTRAFVFPDQPERGVTHWDWTLVPVLDQQGEVEYLVFSLNEVTERKRAEVALRESEVRFRTVLESVALIGLMLDYAGRITLCNDYLLALTGWKREEVLGADWFERFLPPEVSHRIRREIFCQSLATGELTPHYENEIVTRQGERRLIAWSNILFRDSAGQISGVASIGEDITERKRAEVALRESEARYRSLFDNMVEGFAYCQMLFDGDRPQDFVYLAVNHAFETLTGLKNVVGRKVTEILPGVRESDPGFFEIYGRVVRRGMPERVEIYLEALKMWFAISVYSPGQDRFVAVFDVITERKRAEEALRALSLQLSRAEDAERRRIARELHDSTGQKLAALSMTVGMLWDATGIPAGKSEKMLTDCLATIEQCAQEIRTLSYLLHPPLLDELGLAAAVRNYVEGFSKRSGVQVALDAPPDLERLPDEVEIALFRVVQEGFGNIHRHAGASTARLHLACGAEQVTLEVSDQGRGMSAETLRAIETGRGSAGVGIAGMRERLRLLGGRLEIESGGQGTTMRAIIPRRQEPT